MKRNILRVIIIVLAAVLIVELGYIAYRGISNRWQASTDNTASGTQQTDGSNTSDQTTTGDVGNDLPDDTRFGSETKGTEPVATTKPTQSTEPAATTKPTQSTKPTPTTTPTEATEPEETTKPTETESQETTEETRDHDREENELPPMPL